MLQIVVSKQDLTGEWYSTLTVLGKVVQMLIVLRQSTPSVINVFSHSVVGLNGDVATMTNVQEAG